MKRAFHKIIPSFGLFLALLGLLSLPSASRGPLSAIWPLPVDTVPVNCSQPVDQAWAQKVSTIRWVAYSSPSRADSNPLSEEAVYADLSTLKRAGFTGLITYGASGVMGRQFVSIAEELGYEGVILGLWSPTSKSEFNNALRVSASPIVLGYNIGNEGLSERRDRYALSDLCAAITSLRTATGKPVATSEDIDTYYRRPELLKAGDWVFAIAHPYWHWTKGPQQAVQWEQDQYAALQARTKKIIFFKEVGLPSDGALGLSEINQDLYYRALADTDVQFAYFEGFDQPSKSYVSVEPHWGLFNADLSPKLTAWNLMEVRPFTLDDSSRAWTLDCPRQTCPTWSRADALQVGANTDGHHYRSILTFDTAALPEQAVLTSAKLKLHLSSAVGMDPLRNGQRLVVDVCTPSAQKPFQRDLLNQPWNTCFSNAGQLTDAPGDGWYVLELSPEALTSINLTGSTQFRLRVAGQPVRDVRRAYLVFDQVEGASALNPVLVIRYRFPQMTKSE